MTEKQPEKKLEKQPEAKTGKQPEKKVEKKPEKKVGFFAKAKRSSKASLNELKKVHWPTKKELITYTNVVVATVAIIAVLIWVVDSIIGSVFGLII